LDSAVAFYEDAQFDVKVTIELSGGVTFRGVPTAPAGTEYDPVTQTWTIPKLGAAYTAWATLDVPVAASGSRLEDQCLTATVTAARPWFGEDLRRRANDMTTVCLGKDPPVVVNRGELVLWWLHDCVGVSAHPCTGSDELKLFARSTGGEGALPTGYRVDEFTYSRAYTYLEPETVVVQVRDPLGRQYDTNSHSLTGQGIVSWQTGRKDGSALYDNSGIRTWYSRQGFNANIASWSNLVRTVSVSGLDGGKPPGRVKVRHDSNAASTFYDPAPQSYTHMRAPFNLTATATRDSDYFFEFDSLGTYVVNFKAVVTRTDNAKYEAEADYIFHVGPMSDLEVVDGGSSPLVTAGERAYTIAAVNHGPDVAPMVVVTVSGVPPNARVIPSEGEWKERTGTWVIGELDEGFVRVGNGYPEHPTLTIIPPDPDGASPAIRATIANTRDYSVEIDGQTHTTHYFDYVAENNATAIRLVPGSGPSGADIPYWVAVEMFTTPLSANPPAAVVSWQGVELLNRWPVTGYEVHESGDCAERPSNDLDASLFEPVRGELYFDRDPLAGADTCYFVRAVNERDVKGHWKQATVSGSGGPSPRIVLSESRVTVAENGRSASYTVRLNRRPAGAVGVALRVDDPTVAAVSPALLGFTTENWHIPRRVTVSGVDDDAANSGGRRRTTIRHTAQGGRFERADEQVVTVTVTDDGDEAGLVVPGEVLRVTGGGGEVGYSIRLKSRPAADVFVRVTSSNSDVRVRSAEGLLVFTRNNWNRPQRLGVVFNADSGTANIIHTASSDDPNYGGISTAVAVEAIAAVLKPTVSVVAGSCVVSGERATFTLSANHKVAKDLRVEYRIGRNWRAVAENQLGSASATIVEGTDSVVITVPTQQLPTADQPLGGGDTRMRRSGVPGTATLLLVSNPEYNLAAQNVAHVLVYHTSERRHCR